jgi:hypothetical protein
MGLVAFVACNIFLCLLGCGVRVFLHTPNMELC